LGQGRLTANEDWIFKTGHLETFKNRFSPYWEVWYLDSFCTRGYQNKLTVTGNLLWFVNVTRPAINSPNSVLSLYYLIFSYQAINSQLVRMPFKLAALISPVVRSSTN
jgi:hypothetical protein